MPFSAQNRLPHEYHVHWNLPWRVPSHIKIVFDGVAYGFVCYHCTAVGVPFFARPAIEHFCSMHRCSTPRVLEKPYAEHIKTPAAQEWQTIMREIEKILKDKGIIKKTWWERLLRR